MKRLTRLRSAHVAVAIFALVCICSLAACSSFKNAPEKSPSAISTGIRSDVLSISPFCGSGLVDPGEECDGGACCTPGCKLRSAEVICDFVSGTKCSGTSGACPTQTALPSGVTYYASSTGDGICGALESAPVSPPVSPTVSPTGTETPLPGPNAQFVSQYVITRLEPDVVQTFSITMKNTGPLPWMAADGVKLVSLTPNSLEIWGIDHVSLYTGEMVPSGSTRTFQIPIHTTATAGSYDFQWRMVLGNGTLFGDASLKVTIPVFCLTCGGGGGGGSSGGILDRPPVLPKELPIDLEISPR